jgi:hypothetical protein
VWVTVTGAVAFNRWFGMRFSAPGISLNRRVVNLCALVPDAHLTDAASCREETVIAFERIAEAVARGMERSQAIYRFLDMPEVVRQYFMHKNAFHTRAMTVCGGSACA